MLPNPNPNPNAKPNPKQRGGGGGNFPPGQLSAKTKETKHRKEIRNTRRKKTEDAKFYKIKTNFSE